jgi:hypothetical protein
LKHGLTPWRRRGVLAKSDLPAQNSLWSETWKPPEQWIAEMEAALRDAGAVVAHGGNWDEWDLSIRGGLFGGINVLVAVEEHGTGRQLLRFKTRPRVPLLALLTLGGLAILAGLAAASAPWLPPALGLGVATIVLARAAIIDCDTARRQWNAAVNRVKPVPGAGSPPPTADAIRSDAIAR